MDANELLFVKLLILDSTIISGASPVTASVCLPLYLGGLESGQKIEILSFLPSCYTKQQVWLPPVDYQLESQDNALAWWQES